MALGAFLLIKPQKNRFFHQEMLKKIFQKTHQSKLMVRILWTIIFFDTEKLVDWYYNHRINKNLDFWTSQVIKPQKTVFLAIFTRFTPCYWWILTKIWFLKLFILSYTKVQQKNIGRASFEKKVLYCTPLILCKQIDLIYVFFYEMYHICSIIKNYW